jgi:hypothetical protein
MKPVVEFQPHTRMTPVEALGREARNSDQYADVLIIGVSNNGELIIRSSEMNREKAVFMTLKALRWAEGD